MNIFVLDKNVFENAKLLCDKHVIKMITETNQMLTSPIYMEECPLSEEKKSKYYKKTHYNHPCSVWVRQSLNNWLWLFNYNVALCREYSHRFQKIHKGEIYLHNIPFPNWLGCDSTFYVEDIIRTLPHCVPDIYKRNEITDSYIGYYIGEKLKFAKWTNRNIPYLFKYYFNDNGEYKFKE